MARDSWSRTSEALLRIQALKAVPDRTMYDLLLIAACVLYLRPFERSDGLIRLRDYANFDGVAGGDELRRIHVAVDKARNQIMAHRQVSGWDKLLQGTLDGKAGDLLVISVGNGPLSYEVSDPTLHPEFIGHFLWLAQVQEARANKAFFNAIGPVLPSLIVGRKKFLIEAE